MSATHTFIVNGMGHEGYLAHAAMIYFHLMSEKQIYTLFTFSKQKRINFLPVALKI